ncbi:MAG: hypothetical protein AAGL98_10420, partial [Planctomycetota bacterium]
MTTPGTPSASAPDPVSPAGSARVWRIEVRPAAGEADPRDAATLEAARSALGNTVTAVRTAEVFLVEAVIDEVQARRIADELLADPVNQTAALGVAASDTPGTSVEVHYLPGVMDPVAESTQDAIREMLPELDRDSGGVRVRTGTRYHLTHDTPLDRESVRRLARTR